MSKSKIIWTSPFEKTELALLLPFPSIWASVDLMMPAHTRKDRSPLFSILTQMLISSRKITDSTQKQCLIIWEALSPVKMWYKINHQRVYAFYFYKLTLIECNSELDILVSTLSCS